MSLPTLFVSGAGGKLGGLVIEALKSRGYAGKIVAGTRHPAKLAGLSGVEVRKADFADKASLVASLQGVDRFLVISTDQVGGRLAAHLTAVEAAKEAGVKEIFYTSMPNPEAPSEIPFAHEHLGTESAIKATGIPYTIVRMGWYMENLLGILPNNLESGQWFTSTEGSKTSYTSGPDCAHAAAGALLKGAENKTYTVTGPAALSNAQIAAIATEITGKPLSVVEVSDEQLAAGAKAAGVPDFVVDHFILPFERFARAGKAALVTNAVEALWGERPLSVKEFLSANKTALTRAA
ncbi:SDR family oxidoreductase [Sinorhizobium prairiense]|uniref:SDR family oxidoreductase n=1 Tax=unclassified Sinorhizobium TaxID=2613772 RepID=UPI0023D8C9B2|nr:MULTISPECIES: SDR family oxidoreductase [unclassified Sinorhizobium]WEJ08495.1 SDR family oxidoreductase [Sinorhizobium sp. M103]WEJ14004.1 SDR family oxidoreductase [Sinorhizobium sp. K101]WEJ35602.1 SDR family oxidoreductase [Sinorhizobium sp. C101]